MMKSHRRVFLLKHGTWRAVRAALDADSNRNMSASVLLSRIASDRAQACTRVNTSEHFCASAAVYEAAMALRTCKYTSGLAFACLCDSGCHPHHQVSLARG
jgi:hypothetical protein